MEPLPNHYQADMIFNFNETSGAEGTADHVTLLQLFSHVSLTFISSPLLVQTSASSFFPMPPLLGSQPPVLAKRLPVLPLSSTSPSHFHLGSLFLLFLLLFFLFLHDPHFILSFPHIFFSRVCGIVYGTCSISS